MNLPRISRLAFAVIFMVCLSVPAWADAPAASSPATAPVATAIAPASAPVQWQFLGATKEASYAIGSLDKASEYMMQVTLTSQGAAVQNVKLTDYFVTVEDLQLFNKSKSEAQYQAAVAADPHTYQGHYSLLNPVEGENLSLQTRTVGLKSFNETFDVASAQWLMTQQGQQDGKQFIKFELLLCRDLTESEAANPPAGKKVLRLTKTYTLAKNSYSLGVSVTLDDLSGGELTCSLDQAGPAGVPEELHQRTQTQAVIIGKLGESNQILHHVKSAKDLPEMKTAEDIAIIFADPKKKKEFDQWLKEHPENKLVGGTVYVEVGTSVEANPTLWIAEINKYFGAIMYLVPDKPDMLDAPDYKASFYVIAAADRQTSPLVIDNKKVDRSYLTGISIPDLRIEPGKSRTVSFDIFAGPKSRDVLSGEGTASRPEYKTRGYVHTIDISGASSCSFCTFGWLVSGMMWLLELFVKVPPHNWGIAIIVLVVLTRVVLHPLTKKGQVSMSRMQKLAPKMNEIKAKYADDKETLNREMMKVYKEQGMSPVMGCLPMMLQMPIWVALWTALNNAVELRHAAFLPFWITDLAAPDALYTFSHALPVPMVGPIDSINLLPLLLTVATILQTKLTPQMAPSSPDAAKQQKMMMYMMPFMMLLIFYNAPSGLTLYIMASTFAGVAEQYVIRKHIRERDAAEAAAETKVEGPGKGFRSSRGKKPKGPFWTKH